MSVFALVFRNMLRHKLRTALTITGMAVAVMAYALLRTIIGAWYVGLDATAPDRLIVRHAVSFILPLPYSYGERIASVPGVNGVTYVTWFQGTYIDQSNFFPRQAVDAATFFDLYREYLTSDEEMARVQRQRNSCLIGVKTAEKFGLGVGDVMTVEGDIFPGSWQFVVAGIYRGRDRATDETQMFFHWQYLDESLRQTMPVRAGVVGWYVVRISDPSAAPTVGAGIDALFANSPAETRSETERAFAAGFLSMASAIITAMQFISWIVIGIILLVLANTMIMTARERVTEYAVLKTLGFTPFHLAGLIAGESLLIGVLGGMLGLALTVPVAGGIAESLSSFFPVFTIERETLMLAMGFALAVGVIAAVVPVRRAMRTSIVEGLRNIG